MRRFPKSPFFAVFLFVLMLPWASALPSLPLPPAGDRQALRFRLGSFDPLEDALPDGAVLADRWAVGPFLVQFRAPFSGEAARRVERAGGAVAAYVSDGGLVVVGEPGLGPALERLSGVRWVGLVPASLRMHPAAQESAAVSVEFAGGAPTFLVEAASQGARILAVGGRTAVAVPGPSGARGLAALPHVLWVEPYAPPAGANYQAVRTDGIRQSANTSAYAASGGALWTFNGDSATPRFLGYTGSGVTVDITDEGVDGTHPTFAGRLGASTSWSGVPPWTDYSGHGTHVAGSALGDGSYLPQDGAFPRARYAGAAPGATLVAQNYDALALNYSGMAGFAATAGATISVNSWGDASGASLGAYTTAAAEYDALSIDASGAAAGDQPMLFVFSAGNGDNGGGSITSPATAKNVLAVGATGNDVPGLLPSDRVALFSSFGPADDGRIRPDLVAPGEMVASANSTQQTGSAAGPFPPLGGSSYAYRSGTSQAAPQVGGAAAVATQYLGDARGMLATPALLKALLINGATPLSGYAWPGPEQGWGRLNLSASLLNTSGRRVDLVPEGFVTFTSDGISDIVQFTVTLDAGEDFRVTLAWSDPANSPLAASALWNDLDLEVRDPSDMTIFVGNRINTSSAYSVSGMPGHVDGTNNVEVVRVQGAAAGTWKVFVRSYRFVSTPQTFALAFSGAINHTEADIAVESAGLRGAPSLVESGDTVTIDGVVANLGRLAAPGSVVEAVDGSDSLAPPYATATLGTLLAGARAPFSLAFQPPDGENAVVVRARSSAGNSDSANDFATLGFFVVRRQAQLSGAADATALPGQAATFSLLATNGGNAADSLTLAESPGVRDPGWRLSFSSTGFALDAGESAPFQVFVEIPANASEGALTLAELRLVSQGNSSRADFLTITARAGGLHGFSVEPAEPSIVVEPGGVHSVQVRVTNTGNAQDEASVSLLPLWTGAAGWGSTGAEIVLIPGGSENVSLNLSNNDVAAAGYRGPLRIRATSASTGDFVDALVPVFMEARACLAFSQIPDASTTVAAPAAVPVTLSNCGNVALSGPLQASAASDLLLETQALFSLGPHSSTTFDLNARAERWTFETDYEVTLRADGEGGVVALSSFVVHHRSDVNIEEPRTVPTFRAVPGIIVLRLTFHNAGGAGPVAAPLVAGAPREWRVTVQPAVQHAGSDADVAFDVIIDTQADSTLREVPMSLVFYPGSAREGSLTADFRVLVEDPASRPAPGRPTSAWPTDALPALALAAGAAGALALAAALAPSRGLLGACPGCGRKAPRFDTLLNPRCARCGESLLRRPLDRGEHK